jgi:hypothetical protein
LPWWVLISLALLGTLAVAANWTFPRRAAPQPMRFEPYIGENRPHSSSSSITRR